MMAHPPETRPRLGHVLAFVWLGLISVLVAVDHVALTRSSQDEEEHADREAVTALEDSVSALDTQLEALTQHPAVTQASFAIAHRALADRLQRLEEDIGDTAPVGDVTLLHDRLKALESRAARPKRPLPAPPAPANPGAAAAEKPILFQPPFSVVGIELRGGERFLSVAPINASLLGQVRVLRPGDVEGNWRLEALDGKSAQFNVDGQVRRIVIP